MAQQLSDEQGKGRAVGRPRCSPAPRLTLPAPSCSNPLLVPAVAEFKEAFSLFGKCKTNIGSSAIALGHCSLLLLLAAA